MKSVYTIRPVILALAAFFTFQTYAQNKAKIYIKKSENGHITTETREVEIGEGQDIEAILKEMGILDEFGQLKDGQSFSINIEKMDGMDNQHINMMVVPPLPPGPPSSPFPPDAIAPEMWEFENRAFLGVMLKESSDLEDDETVSTGVEISEIIPGTAAEEVGLLAGDVIVELDNIPMTEVFQAVEYIQSKTPGDKISIEITREGKKKKFNATLGEKTDDFYMYSYPGEMDGMEWEDDMHFRFDDDSIMILYPSSPNCVCPNDSMKICMPFSWNDEGFEEQETSFLGVTPAADQIGTGVKVMVVEGSSAESMGIEDGDVIRSFNGTPVNNFDELAEQIAGAEPGTTVGISLDRKGTPMEVSGELGVRTYSGCEDIRIFKDYKGMDEDGSYFFDYEFDMDQDNIEQQMQELMERLEAQQEMLQNEIDRLHENRMSMEIEIVIQEITPAEAEMVNQNPSANLETKNDLNLDRISFFPNPGNGIVNLNFQTSDTGDLNIDIFDTHGNIVYMEEMSNFTGNYTNTIDISNQPDGSYFMQIRQNGKSYSKKLVKG